MSRFNTQQGISTSALDTQLRNQGVQPGTEAWDNAFRPLNQQQTDAQVQAELNEPPIPSRGARRVKKKPARMRAEVKRVD